MLRTRTIGNTPSVFSTFCYKRKANLTMNEKLAKYLDGVFSQYEDETAIRELKEELRVSLQERWNDLKGQGYDDETAYKMTIDSIGDISEAIQSIAGKTKELKQMVRKNFSLIHLENSDLQGIRIHDGKFNYSRAILLPIIDRGAPNRYPARQSGTRIWDLSSAKDEFC
jgi:8-oxo-dGTP pyrophosphatase MutT (NUDIX family)